MWRTLMFQGKPSLDEVLIKALRSDDFLQHSIPNDNNIIVISYYQSLVKEEKINQFVLTPIQWIDNHLIHLENLIRFIPIDDIQIYSDPVEVELKLLQGYIAVQLNNNKSHAALINTGNLKR